MSDENKIIISDDDVAQMMKLNPLGDKGVLKYTMGTKCGKYYENELIDAKYLINKYRQYLLWWQNKYGDQEEKWIRAPDKLKTCCEFLDAQMHLQIFEVTTKLDNRTIYMFGDIEKIKLEYEKTYQNNTHIL